MIAALFLSAAIAAASNPTAAAPIPEVPVVASAPVPVKPSRFDDVICEKVEASGTRLNVQRVCMKRSRWDDVAAGNRQWLNKQQDYRTPPPADGGIGPTVASNPFGTPN